MSRRGTTIPTTNLIKTQIPTRYSESGVIRSCLSGGLATIGVCVFCALTSVGALLFYTKGVFMKKSLLKLLVLCIVVCSALCFFTACDSTGQNERNGLIMTKADSGRGYVVTGVEDREREIINIPSSYRGEPVIAIGEFALCNCRNLTSVTIPNSVKSIGDGAFQDSRSLTSITIPNSVTSIGFAAFYDCRSLQYNEYNNAYYLGNSNNPYLVLVEAKYTNITTCGIYDNTRFICEYAFRNCTSLTSITIPDSVTSIGNSAFNNCDSLTSVTIGSGVKNIDMYAFSACSKLTSITIPDSVTSIGKSAFGGCSSLTSITFENTTGWKAGSTSISSSNLANKSTAATYLTSTYKDRTWTRS
jgi:hypothetical protein